MPGPCPCLTRTLWDQQASRQLCSFSLLPGDLPLTQASGLASMAPSEIWPLLFQAASPLQPPPDSLLEAGGHHGALHSVCRENLTWVQVLT